MRRLASARQVVRLQGQLTFRRRVGIFFDLYPGEPLVEVRDIARRTTTTHPKRGWR